MTFAGGFSLRVVNDSRCAWSTTFAAIDDEDGQVIDDGIAAIAAGAAEASGDDLQAVMADGAGYPAKVFESETHA